MKNAQFIDFIVDQGSQTIEELFANVQTQLIGKKIVNPGYGQALLSREREYPTGLKISDEIQIAIPHTDSEFCQTTGIVVCKTTHPIEFIHMATEDVKLNVNVLFFILTNNHKLQPDILQELLSFAADQKNILKILDSNSLQDFESK